MRTPATEDARRGLFPGDGSVEQRDIANRSGKWPELVEAILREGEGACVRVPIQGGAKSAHTAERGGDPDRAERVRTDRERRDTCGHGGSRPTTASPGHTLEVMWVPGWTERTVVVGPAEGQLGEVGLAQHDGARIRDPSHDVGVRLGQ